MAGLAIVLLLVAFGLMLAVFLFHIVMAILFGLVSYWPIVLGCLIVGWFIASRDDGPMTQDKNDG